MRFGPPKVKSIHLCLYSSKVEYLDIFLVRQTNLFIYLFLISKNHIYTKGCSVQLDRLIYEENYFSLLTLQYCQKTYVYEGHVVVGLQYEPTKEKQPSAPKAHMK